MKLVNNLTHKSLFEQVVMDTLGSVIVESKRSKAADKRTREVIRQHFNNAGWLDTAFNHQDNPEGLTYLEYMFKQFKDTFYHDNRMSDRPIMRLEPLITKIAFELGFQTNTPDATKLERLRRMVNLMDQLSQQDKYDLSQIPLDASYEALDKEFGEIIDDANKAESEDISNTEYTRNNEYTILGPLTYEEAKKYGDQSCPGSLLCYTQREGTWNSTQYANDGINNCYVALKNGWENIPPDHTDGNSAYDEYGLSMIFVFVDPDGNIATCNTRWNHKADYAPGFSCDNAMGKKELSELLGVRFDSVFKPKSKEEVRQMGYISLDDVQEMLDNGQNPFNRVDRFSEGFASVRIRDKFNFIDENSQLLSPNQWFDCSEPFKEGFGRVELNGKWNFINKDGDIVFSQWYDGVSVFSEGLCGVMLGDKWNFINKKGEIVLKDWYNGVGTFHDGFAWVYWTYKGYNFVNKEGKLLWKGKQWFNFAYSFHEGFAGVEFNRRSAYYINTKGQLCDFKTLEPLKNQPLNESLSKVFDIMNRMEAL